MEKFEIELHLNEVRRARTAWRKAMGEFENVVARLMARLIHEAAINRMSAEDIAKHSGMTPKRVRMLMRTEGLDPRRSKTLLSKSAAEALASNAALLGVKPTEIDLMSPLVYLPMGQQLREMLEEKAEPGIDMTEPDRTPAQRISASIQMGIAAEEDWDGPSIKPGDLSSEQIEWLATWLAGDGIGA